MQNFVFSAPTQIFFGRGTEEGVGEAAKKQLGEKVLLHYGQSSIIKSGLKDRVCRSLRDAGVEVVELGGVLPNPRLQLVREGIELCRSQGVQGVLAIGGGSVIDSAKAMAIDVGYKAMFGISLLVKPWPKGHCPLASCSRFRLLEVKQGRHRSYQRGRAFETFGLE